MKSVNFDISRFDSYREDNRREVKKAKGGLPISLWETYSAFANCYGGIIILGIKENKDGSWYMTGLDNAAKLSAGDHVLHPTAAGLLMFGEEYKILYEFPEYFLDYREILDPAIRWTDRLQSSSGDWSGNLFDFFFRVYGKIVKDLKIPFKLEGITRIDDTPVHKALREALANCIVNTDFYFPRGIVIRKDTESITMENPGSIRTGKAQMLKGGISDPRNKALMKMFNLIGIGERAGSGVPDIYSVWEQQGWKQPEVAEEYGPDRTILKLSFVKSTDKKVLIKSADKKALIKSADKKALIKSADKKKYTNKTRQQLEKITEWMEPDREYRIAEIAEFLGIKETRARELMRELIQLEKINAIGKNKSRRYKKAVSCD